MEETTGGAAPLSQWLRPHALALARSGRYRAALDLLELLGEQRADAAHHMLVGRIHAQNGDIQAATDAFEAALQIDPDSSEAATALAAVGTLGEPLTALLFWGRRVVVMAAVLLLPVVLLERGTANPDELVPGSNAPDPTPAGAPATAEAVDPAAFTQFVSMHDSLRTLGLGAAIELVPRYEGGTLRVAVAGSVPSAFLRDRLVGALSVFEGTDTDGVVVAGRYTVLPDETLRSIAAWAYGSAARWPELWEANAALINDPDLIEPGWELTVR